MWADWMEAVLTRAGFRVLPRSTVTTGGHRRRHPRQHPGRARTAERSARHRRAVLGVPALAGCPVDLEDALVGRHHRSAPPADPGPDQRRPGHRAVQRAPSGGPGADGRGPGDREAAVGAGPARAADREHGGPGRGAPVPRHDPAHLERPAPQRRLHRARRDAGTAPRQARRRRPGRGGRPGAVRAGRRRQDPARAGVRAPLHGRLRPGLVGAVGAGRGDQRGARGPGPQDGPQDRRQRGGGRGGRPGGAAPRHHPALAAHLRQRRRPQATASRSCPPAPATS